MTRGEAGAVKITLHSNHLDHAEKAEVTVCVKNPGNAVERMLNTLAQRFPPESVVTIAPTAVTSAASSVVATSTEGSRSSSSSSHSSGGPMVSLSPALRRGMATLPPELSSWVLANNPAIFPLLLDLATRGGDAKEFAARLGLSPEPIEAVVHHLSRDPDFFEWLSLLAASAKNDKSVNKSRTSPFPLQAGTHSLSDQHINLNQSRTDHGPHGEPHGEPHSGPHGLPHGGVSRSSPSFERPVHGHSTISHTAHRHGQRHAQPSEQRHGQSAPHPSSQMLGYPQGLPPPAVGLLPKDDGKQSYWLVNNEGQVVGHSDGEGQHVLHGGAHAAIYPYAPRQVPRLGSPGATMPRDLTSIPRNSEHPEEGSWLLNREHKVVGHTNAADRIVMHPATDLHNRVSQPSGFAGLNVVPRNTAHAEDGGPWLIDSAGHVVGHYDQRGRPVMHPVTVPKASTALPSPLPGLTSVTLDPSNPSEGSWLLDRHGRVVGHTDKSNCAIMHPQSPLSMSDAKSSGVPELHMIPRDPKHPENGGPWLVDKHGFVIGHYDRERRPVMHPADAVRLATQPSEPTAASWIYDSAGRVIGHTDAGGKPVMHPPGPLDTSASRPSGLPGVSVVSKSPQQDGPWLVDVQGRIVGHYDAEGRVLLHPTLQPPSSPVPGLQMRPITPTRPLEGSWLLNADGKIVGHTDPSNAPVFHPARPLHSANSRPSGLPGVSVIPREAARPEDGGPWLVDSLGNVVGHYDSDGRAVLQPMEADLDSETPFIPMDATNPRGPAWVVDPASGHVIGHVERSGDAPIHHTVSPLTQSLRPSGVPGLSITDGPHNVQWLLDARNQLVGHLCPQGRARFHPLLGTQPLTKLRSSAAAPALRELLMNSTHPEEGVWLVDEAHAVVGHHLPTERSVMHPKMQFPSDAASPTALPGLKRVRRSSRDAMRAVSWGCDEHGQVLGHFRASDGAFILHPRSPRFSFRGTSLSPVLTEMPKDPARPELGCWLLSREGTLVGHTDTKGRPIMHPQRPFARGVGMSVGIAGISLVSRDSLQPEMGGPWLVGDDGHVIGHFEPEGRPVLHPNFHSRLSQSVPSPVAGFSAAYIDPERPSDGVWLINADGELVGHAGLNGTVQLHPKGPLSGEVQSNLRGLGIVQRNPLDGQSGGPWVVDANGCAVAHYSADGRLVLHPPAAAKMLLGQWTETPPSLISHMPPSRGASSTGDAHIGDSLSSDAHAHGHGDRHAHGHAHPERHAHDHGHEHTVIVEGSSGGPITSEPITSGRPVTMGPVTMGPVTMGPAATTMESGVAGLESGLTASVALGSYVSEEVPGVHFEADGMRVRYIEVPVVEEKITEVARREVREVERRVPKIEYQVVEKVVEVPEVRYVERRVSKEVIEEVVRRVPRKEIVEVPREVVRHVPRIETRVVEKVVEKPEVVEVPKPFRVEQKVSVPRYVNQEQPAVVAQKLRPLIRETKHKTVVEANTYEPVLFAVDVYVPKPVQSCFTATGKLDERHDLVEIPAPQYNSLLRAMNAGKPEEALTDLFARGPAGIVPFLPLGELSEVVAPLPGVVLPGQHSPHRVSSKGSPLSEGRSRRRGRSAHHHRRRAHSSRRRGRSLRT